MDTVFKALNDPSRRLLLDSLRVKDGQSLGELCEHLPAMTRYGVMSHLGVLEEAGLVTTHRSGRRKLHYLNAVPIREIHDRWISRFTEPVAETLVSVRTRLEGGRPMPADAPTHVYETYIQATPEAVWDAITDGAMTVQYFYGTRVQSTWEQGAPIRYLGGDDEVVASGEVLEIEPPSRLSTTFHAHWDPELEEEGPVRQDWIVEPVGPATRLRVEYYDLPAGSRRAADFLSGIPLIVSGLKTLLETGSPLTTA